ncbi:MAG: hypothetical protein ACTHMM_05585 [Agriterribacter sp.]
MSKVIKINPEELAASAVVDKYKPNLKRFDKAKKMVGLVVTQLKVYETVISDESQDAAMEILKVASNVEKAIEKKRKEQVAPWNDGASQINAYVKDLVKDIKPSIDSVKKAVLSYQDQKQKKALAERSERRISSLLTLGFSVDNNLYRHPDAGVITNNEINNYEDPAWLSVLERTTTKIKEAAEKVEQKNEEVNELSALFGGDDEPVTKPVVSQSAVATSVFQAASAPTTSISMPSNVKGTTKKWTFEILDASKVPREYLKVDETAIREAIGKGIRSIDGVRIYQDTSLTIR